MHVRKACLFYAYIVDINVFCLILESENLFLRHNKSGKCITTGKLVYNNPDHAIPYFAVMTDNCLNSSAQFRYLETELLHNIDKDGTLASPLPANTFYNCSLAVYHGVSKNGLNYQKSLDHRLKQTDAGSLFFHNMRIPVCAAPETKFIKRSTTCDRKSQDFTFGK